MNKPTDERKKRRGRPIPRKQVNVSLNAPAYETLSRQAAALGKSVGSLVRSMVESCLAGMSVRQDTEVLGMLKLKPYDFDYTVDEHGALELWGMDKYGGMEWKIRVE